MGQGVQSGWPTFTDGSSGVAPAASDCNRWSTDINRLSVRPAGCWLRYDDTLVADAPTWHNCRVSSTVYEVDAEGGTFIGTISGTADTWTIPTTGLYDLSVRERLSGPVNGNHALRIVNASTQVTVGDAYSEQPITPLHVQVHHLYAPAVYLTAGTTLNFQHRYDGFGDNRDLTLYTGAPTPAITIRMVGETTVHA